MTIQYFFLFGTMIFFGAEAMLAAGSLSHFGVFDFWLASLMILGGLLISDSIFFFLGKKFGETFVKKCGRFIFISEKKFIKLQAAFSRKGWLVIFLSKFIYCLGHLTSAVAGTMKMKFKEFFLLQIFSSGLSVLFFVALGYYFSTFIDSITKDFKIIGLSIIILLAALFFAEKLIVKLFNKKFVEKIKDAAINGWNNISGV